MKKKVTGKPSVCLPSHISPTQYEVTLKPDLEAHTFSGEITISLSLTKPSKEITLHSKDLEILSATAAVGKEKIQADAISYNDKLETATFAFHKRIPTGRAKLHIVFRGILSDNMRGFYKSKYVIEGQERFIAATQFEATDARACIPCFDEPAQKAIFDVNLIVPVGKEAISNTLPVSVREHEAGYKIVSFAPTPKMSTYLLAFIVGDFEWIEKKTKKGVLVRIMTVPGKKHQATFALEVAVKGLEFYEKYFDIAYPLNTLDMVALPDFASAAMENWGAITYRETALLVDPDQTSLDSKRWVALVILHELAHQWFGNLVTMEWWTHLWLNEGFAAYMEHLALDEIYPEYDIWSQFVSGAPSHGLGSTLRPDSQLNTHPIEVDVHDPSEIGEIFDAISYSKGATVIRMLAEYLGKDDFRNGLRYYLKKHSYTNASTIHLWEAFEKVSGKPVKKMMAVWTGKSGYPLVSATRKGDGIELSQQRFFANPKSAKKAADTTLWSVPLSVITPRGEKSFGLMEKKKLTIPAGNTPWIKLNSREVALHRTQYDAQLLSDLLAALKEGRLSAVDRLGIIRDAFALAPSGHLSATTGLEIIAHCKDETEYIVWEEIVTGLSQTANITYGTSAYEPLRAFARSVLFEMVNRVGWEPKTNETPSDTMLRGLILGAASAFGDARVIAKVHKFFANRKKEPIRADLRGIVYGAVARDGGEKEYKVFLEMYRTEELHEEKERALNALASFKNKTLLSNALAFGFSDEVRPQNKIHDLWRLGLASTYGRDLTWRFVKKNWTKIMKFYGEGNHILAYIVLSLSRHTTMDMHKDIKTFFAKNKVPAATRAVQQALEYVETNALWKNRDLKNIEKWLSKHTAV